MVLLGNIFAYLFLFLFLSFIDLWWSDRVASFLMQRQLFLPNTGKDSFYILTVHLSFNQSEYCKNPIRLLEPDSCGFKTRKKQKSCIWKDQTSRTGSSHRCHLLSLIRQWKGCRLSQHIKSFIMDESILLKLFFFYAAHSFIVNLLPLVEMMLSVSIANSWDLDWSVNS